MGNTKKVQIFKIVKFFYLFLTFLSLFLKILLSFIVFEKLTLIVHDYLIVQIA